MLMNERDEWLVRKIVNKLSETSKLLWGKKFVIEIMNE